MSALFILSLVSDSRLLRVYLCYEFGGDEAYAKVR